MIRSHNRRTRRTLSWVVALIALALIGGFYYLNFHRNSPPVTAESGRLSIVAALQPDNTLRVTRSELRRQLERQELRVVLPPLNAVSRYRIEKVSVGLAGSAPETYQSVSSTSARSPQYCELTEEFGPKQWTYSRDDNVLRICLPRYQDQAQLELTYSVTNAARVFTDFAYLPMGITEASNSQTITNASIQLQLPLPNGSGEAEKIQAKGAYGAAAHVTATDSGVRAEIPLIQPGQSAFARIVFPKEWLNQIPAYNALHAYNQSAEKQLAATIEQKMGAPFEGLEERSLLFRMIGLAPGILSLLFTVFYVLYPFNFGRAKFRGKYWRDNPGAGVAQDRPFPTDVHPLVVAVNHTGRSIGRAAFNAALMRLNVRGYLRLEQLADGDYLFTRTELEPGQNSSDLIDRAVLEFLFGALSHDGKELLASSLQRLGPGQPRVKQAGAKLAELIDQQCIALDLRSSRDPVLPFVSLRALKYQVFACLMGAPIFGPIPGSGLIALVFNLLSLAISIGLLALSRQQLPANGRELYAYTEALRRWLKDFTNLEESVPDDSQIWGQYMVFAILFDLPDEVFRAARTSASGLIGSDALGSVSLWFVESNTNLSLSQVLGAEAVTLTDAIDSGEKSEALNASK